MSDCNKAATYAAMSIPSDWSTAVCTGGIVNGIATTVFTDTSDPSLKTAVEDWCIDDSAAQEKYGDIEDWDVSAITSMERLTIKNILQRHCKFFNENINKWDTGRVTSMKVCGVLSLGVEQ